ncbi:hypothetical protein G4D82_05105 [Flavobacterium sp. CYK-4]|uniref:hypothetical protein n=1 Tax=Flavobacterium lotistagni TaxID=2709660 RepID=UPI00140C68F1|nr:hypothetical protein [Flavobacterium lotistagni]NHM06590.1 hypothetical protein [Flavobacterium lotistagni]
MENEFELIVSQGKRPFWQRLMAAICFTGVLYLLFNIVLLFYRYGFSLAPKAAGASFELIAYFLVTGIGFSMTKTILIDTDKDKLISRFCIGPFSRDVLSQVPELDYVLVFLDGKGYYQTNLWYKGNKHYRMYAFDEKKPAMDFAAQVSERLKLDMLDATEKGNSKWIEQKSE